jgi:hypothetical protein
MESLVFKVSGEVMAKFRQYPKLMLKSTVCPEIPNSETGRVLTIVTHKSLTVWSQRLEHQKDERVSYQNGIRDFHNFGPSETQKLS